MVSCIDTPLMLPLNALALKGSTSQLLLLLRPEGWTRWLYKSLLTQLFYDSMLLAGRTDPEAEALILWPSHEKRRLPGKDADVRKV